MRAHALLPTLLMALVLGALAAACRPADGDAGLRLEGWLSADHALTAFVFLSVECPLSQNYTKQLGELDAAHPEVRMVGVFPLADDDEPRVAGFRDKYAVAFDTRLDHAYELVDALQPAVTPEVFLVAADGEVVYSGKIDNWAVELGRTRKAATEHYLDDAIRAHLAGEETPLRRVEPVGCFLPDEPNTAHDE